MAIDPEKIFTVQERLRHLILSIRNPSFRDVRLAVPRGAWQGVPAAAVQYDWLYPVRFATNRLSDYQYFWFITWAFSERNTDEAQRQLVLASVSFENALSADFVPDAGEESLREIGVGRYELSDVGPAESFQPSEGGNPVLQKTVRFMAEMEEAA